MSKTHLSLFSGIGGLDIAAEWAGFTTVGQCEWADYPTKVLEKHWPDVPKWRDIQTLTGDDFYARTGLRTVDLISGGFPCQPFSCAGKRRGKADNRYLWPEMLRVVRELKPAWVVGENVAGIIGMALDDVLTDLEGQGYETRAFVLPACGVGALHRRYRVAIVAYSNGYRQCEPKAGKPRHDEERNGLSQEQGGRSEFHENLPGCEALSDAAGQIVESPAQRSAEERGQRSSNRDWWETEPNVARVAYGIPAWVDRIKALGNAVVPQQFYPVFEAIGKIERSVQNEP